MAETYMVDEFVLGEKLAANKIILSFLRLMRHLLFMLFWPKLGFSLKKNCAIFENPEVCFKLILCKKSLALWFQALYIKAFP